MLDLHAERHQAGSQFPELYDHVSKLKSRYELETCRVRPRDSLMIRRESDRELIQELIKRYREFPQEQQAQLPALLNSLAQLEVIIGDFISAQRDFDHVAEMVNDHGDRAEAHYNTYRTAIECRRWAEALAALLRACGLNRESCEPFPLDRYQPESILGAGGFGVSFLCREISTDRQVVVKSLREDTIDRDFNQIFNELQWLKELQHPLILAALDWGFADSDHQKRPYVVYEK